MKNVILSLIIVAFVGVMGCASTGDNQFEKILQTMQEGMLSNEQVKSLMEQGVKSGQLTKSQGDLIMKIAPYMLKATGK